MRHTPASKALAKYKVLDLTRARAGASAAARSARVALDGWCTEGLETADLQEAKVLLEDLRA